MVTGELTQLAVAQSIGPAVADVRHVDLRTLLREKHPHDGGAHAVHLTVLDGRLEDLPVRQLDAGDEPVLVDAEVRIEAEGPGRVLGGGRLEERGDGVRGHLAGDVARAMAAHAVRHDEELVLGQHANAVLVVLALEPNVR